MTDDKQRLTEPPPKRVPDRRGLYAGAERLRQNPGAWMLLEEGTSRRDLAYLYRINGVRRAPALRDTRDWVYDVTARSLGDGTDRFNIYARARRATKRKEK